ncbi:DNA replication/repair protein RecF [Coxiella endosymbiont of Amblyomma sculptum]|uniref:DNA replication/repair protein RecF n=1 Tax=Coxiella endosymbiont of Amblyomma sculptum TaxID=2487929 RepID=UPI00132E9FC0|nr:DNA replication/repair protein RecF [Coxiella endosymbiont of Amblyomma sculptum]QHG92196.1 DNA replication/repair protein RecF [Coxiella endosymbiont of Amblyomma sculptum]
MPKILSLQINQFRNLKEVVISPTSGFNLFFGLNGSGKTSVLESIHFLGVGRSFRTHCNQRLIQHTANRFSVFATLKEKEQHISLGIEQYRLGKRRLKINGEEISDRSLLAKRLPLCPINAMSHRFFLDGPKIRRQFLDCLSFHMEPNFFPTWKRIRRLLRQRNAALKLQLPFDEITQWDQMFSEDAECIHKLRKNIVAEFNAIFSQILQYFLPNVIILLCYYPGWIAKQSLLKQLQFSLRRDLQCGYTQIGPQRADFRLSIQKLPAQDVLSQGQQKLVTYALYISKGLLFKKKNQAAPIYLIDDLTAELDIEKRYRVVDLLIQLKSQVFITNTNFQEIEIPDSSIVFHVQNGIVHPFSLSRKSNS